MIIERLILSASGPALDLHRRCHDQAMTEAVFQWKYLDNPHGTAVTWVAREIEDGPLIGMVSLFPRKFIANDTTYMSGQAGDGMVDRAHHRKGIFTLVAHKMIEEFESEGFDFLFGFPNTDGKSLAALLKVPPFASVLTLTHYRRLWQVRSLAKRVFKLNLLAHLAEPAIKKWFQSKDKLRVQALEIKEGFDFTGSPPGFVVDREWIEWRCRAPDRIFKGFQWDDGGVLLRIEQKIATVYYIRFGNNPEAALRGLLDQCVAIGLDAIYFSNHVSSNFQTLLKTGGFIRRSSAAEHFLVASNNNTLKKVLQPEAISLFRGDFDVP